MDMPKVRVSLPKPLLDKVEAHGLSLSELLEKAIRREILRQDLLESDGEHVVGLLDRIDEPSPADVAWARKVARQLYGSAEAAAS
ncbi:MAG: hypothetical protein OXH86_18730 [Acidimicrobiaceae bacterium]|nr:hypothetical protein [Acidimicrobiaceae bacterium]MDE0319752.1 hypothetical protein [Acidimicrobiaceae bacterium]MDE0499379.1 hypothetical protein [Acidimicrobiaceae bacterium]